jgi:hypothetical protein
MTALAILLWIGGPVCGYILTVISPPSSAHSGWGTETFNDLIWIAALSYLVGSGLLIAKLGQASYHQGWREGREVGYHQAERNLLNLD